MYRPNSYSGSRTSAPKTDWWIVLCYLLLVFIGWTNIYASICNDVDISMLSWTNRSGKQFVWIMTGIALALLVTFVIPPRIYEPLAPFLYILALVLLVAVIFAGSSINGSHSWFKLGPVSFQPAELSKITTALMLSCIMSRGEFRMKGRDFWTVVATIVLPMLIIVMEKETGSALVYLGFIFMLYREGLSGWLIALVGLAIVLFILTLIVSPAVSILVLTGIISFFDSEINEKLKIWFPVAVPLIAGCCFLPENTLLPVSCALCAAYFIYSFLRALRGARQQFRWMTIIVLVCGALLVFSTNFIFNNVLRDYQRGRIEVLLGMKEDLSGAGYNVYQSKIAIGSGGFWGKGFCNGTQTPYGFVPEQSTDFIFCTIGEQWGFAGCVAVIALYLFLIIRIILDSEHSREDFTRIYGYCVAGIFFMHIFINIGMTLGLMPVIGIPLPFISYGGSSMWAFTVLLFIFVALYRNEKKYF